MKLKFGRRKPLLRFLDPRHLVAAFSEPSSPNHATADFLYFKNFVRISKAAEWRQNRGNPIRLNNRRDCWYFGNVEDGDHVLAHVTRDGDACTTLLNDIDGRRLFLSLAEAPLVTIAER